MVEFGKRVDPLEDSLEAKVLRLQARLRSACIALWGTGWEVDDACEIETADEMEAILDVPDACLTPMLAGHMYAMQEAERREKERASMQDVSMLLFETVGESIRASGRADADEERMIGAWHCMNAGASVEDAAGKYNVPVRDLQDIWEETFGQEADGENACMVWASRQFSMSIAAWMLHIGVNPLLVKKRYRLSDQELVEAQSHVHKRHPHALGGE